MEKPNITPNFTVADIHKIREYHYELTKDMTFEERAEFYREGSRQFNEYMAEHNRAKKQTAV